MPDGITISATVNGYQDAILQPNAEPHTFTVSITPSSWYNVNKYSVVQWEIVQEGTTDSAGAEFYYDQENNFWGLTVKDTAIDGGVFICRPYLVSTEGASKNVYASTNIKVTFQNPTDSYVPSSDIFADLKSFKILIAGHETATLTPGYYNLNLVFSPSTWGIKNAGKYSFYTNCTGSNYITLGFGSNVGEYPLERLRVYVHDGVTSSDKTTLFPELYNTHNTSQTSSTSVQVVINGKEA